MKNEHHNLNSIPYVFVDPDDSSVRVIASSFTFDEGRSYGAVSVGLPGELELIVTGDQE